MKVSTLIKRGSQPVSLPKSPTGIQGLDEITSGGLPKGRPTLICGSAGCGKTLFAMEFLVHGCLDFNEPGVFMSFEETGRDLASNVASLGFDLERLAKQNKLLVDYVHLERNEIEETGEYDLTGLFIRLGHAIDSISAKRVVLDTIETLFAGLPNQAILRSELRRLFRWLKDKGVTAVITAERGDGALTRHGLEEYVSDCVILLDHRVHDQVSTRRLRVVKYRGSFHGTNEYPFLIDEHGISVLPITSARLSYPVPNERVSTGLKGLDEMLGGKGIYRGSSILVSGTPGTGKTILGGHFAQASCQRGERCLFFSFEESQKQILRNLRSVGVDLQPWINQGLLRFETTRPNAHGLEMHLAIVHKLIKTFRPKMVVVDPMNNLLCVGSDTEVKAMLTRLADFLKANQITSIFNSLGSAANNLETTDVGFSSLMDTWILLRDIELWGERNRGLYVLKSRGMQHSNQIREFTITPHGLRLTDAYLGPEGVLTGSARLSQEAAEQATELARRHEIQRRQKALELKRKTLQAQMENLQLELQAEEEELASLRAQENLRAAQMARVRADLARSRQAVSPAKGNTDAPARRR